MRNSIYLIIIIIISFSIQSCGEKKQLGSKSIDQLHKENGIPVKELIIQTQELMLSLNYVSTLEGIKQATVSSLVNDKVEKFNLKIGSQVSEKKVVVEFPINNSTLHFEQSRVGYENYKKSYEKTSAQLAAGETSQQNFDKVETQYLVAKRNYESLEQMLFVEAPFSGIIVEKFVQEGMKVKVGDKLFTIAQTDKMKSIFLVTDAELQYLQIGMKIDISINNKKFSGSISKVGNVQDTLRKAYKIEAEFANPKRELKVGMTVDIKFDYYKNPNAIVIPRSGIIEKDGKNYVYLTNGSTVSLQKVILGKTIEEDIEVISGLKPGDRMIYQGVGLLSNGAKVQINQ